MPPFKLGIMGTHSTGKTTFLAGLRATLDAKGYAIESVADLARDCASKGFPILDRHNFESTLWIMVTGIQQELEAMQRLVQVNRPSVLLVDRPVPDALGYLMAAMRTRNSPLEPHKLSYLQALAQNHSATYDLTLRTVLDTALPLREGMKPADRNSAFRTMAGRCVDEAIKHVNLRPLSLTSTNAERMTEKVVSAINRHFSQAVEHLGEERSL